MLSIICLSTFEIKIVYDRGGVHKYLKIHYDFLTDPSLKIENNAFKGATGED